jgi:aryl-alcohol dehydrogenase-like predicted oxidoreductase
VKNLGSWCLIHATLEDGLLSGKYNENTSFPEDDWRSNSDLFRRESFRRNLAVVEQLKRLAQQREQSVAQLAIGWSMSIPS